MFRGLFLITGLAAVVLVSGASHDEIITKCKKLLHPGSVFCCNIDIQGKKDHFDELSGQCSSLPDVKPACERAKCIADKLGISITDGKVDQNQLKAMVKEDFKQYPGISDEVDKKCFSGDLDKYGREEDCDIRKIVNCMSIQVLRQCPDWKNEGHCEGTKEASVECLKLFP